MYALCVCVCVYTHVHITHTNWNTLSLRVPIPRYYHRYHCSPLCFWDGLQGRSVNGLRTHLHLHCQKWGAQAGYRGEQELLKRPKALVKPSQEPSSEEQGAAGRCPLLQASVEGIEGAEQEYPIILHGGCHWLALVRSIWQHKRGICLIPLCAASALSFQAHTALTAAEPLLKRKMPCWSMLAAYNENLYVSRRSCHVLKTDRGPLCQASYVLGCQTAME